MTTSKEDSCRVCGGGLQGNQRRWLFTWQNKRATRTHSDSSCKGSPWGSTVSLGSSASLSKGQQLVSTSWRGTDLYAVLTHILGHDVPRGAGRGEFACGKCATVLERVFRFDTVIARVKALSAERLQRLTLERERVKEWVCGVYRQRNPQEYSVGTEGGSQGYGDMLRDNMALAQFECWSEKWSPCPYFEKTGKRCRKGKKCEGCDSLRVSDSAYESVCGLPRNMPPQSFSPLPLSRDKSRSMPLHWSSSSSCHSFRGASCSSSVHSLDSLDGPEQFDWLEELPINVGNVLRDLKRIEVRPVSSPSGSKIPVWDRKREVRVGTGVIRTLSFGEGDEEEEEELNGEGKDVLTDLSDEFIPVHRQNSRGTLHNIIRQLRTQLDQAHTRIRTLETEVKSTNKQQVDVPNGSELLAKRGSSQSGGDVELLHSLGHALHCRENLVQGCVEWMGNLGEGKGDGADVTHQLGKKLTEMLKSIRTDTEKAFESRLSEQKEKERGLQRELDALRKASKQQQRDLGMLNTVLQRNQDVISELRVELAEHERVQREWRVERQTYREREQTVTALLQEKQAAAQRLQEALESAHRDVQALSDSVIGMGVSGSQAEAVLASQLKEKDAFLSSCLRNAEELSTNQCQELSKLSQAVNHLQDAMQRQRDGHSQALSALSAQLRDTKSELREKDRENRETKLWWEDEMEERRREERNLRESVDKRDKLIQQMLMDCEERDRVLTELQHNILHKLEPRTALKHTL